MGLTKIMSVGWTSVDCFSKWRESLWTALLRVAGGDHQKSSLAVAVQNGESVVGVAFGLPAVQRTM